MINAQRADNKPSKKNTTALGLPDDLFPLDAISKEDQLAIVTRINRQHAADRHYIQTANGYCCFIHHTESMWVAVWHRTDLADLAGDGSEYIYGVSVAYKAAPSVSGKIGRMRLNAYRGTGDFIVNAPEKMEEIKYGRTSFLKTSMLITLDDIQNGTTEPAWLCSLSPWGRTSNKYATARQFSDSIRRFILTWHDANSSAYVFSRISDKNKSVAKAIRLDTQMGFDHAGNFINLPGDLTAESLIKAICNESSNAVAFLSTPFFRREAQRVADVINALYHKPDGKLDDVCIPYKLWHQQLRLVSTLTSVYGADVAVDHIQKMYQIGAHLIVRDIRPSVAKWFKTNTPITSFIQWFERALKAQQQEWQAAPESMRRSARYSETEQPTFNFNSFNDTINMMATLHVRQAEGLGYDEREAALEAALLDLKAPSRWRLAEFHDHVSAKVWLTSNKNEDLPQDLFPAPIKVEHLGSTWTFFQPRDIHQLGQWGQAVRNCVGNASNYREDVKKKASLIVLAMIDQKPRFTIQVKVCNGVLEVNQIADIGNRRLDDNERSSYELTFAKALILQDQLLPAQVEAET
jgi:hypothetical protein